MNIGMPFNPFRVFVGAFIPNALLKYPGISPAAKVVLGRLHQYAGQKGTCWPRQDKIAEEVGLSTRYVKQILAELEAKGFIARKRPEGKDRLQHLPCEYSFLWHEIYNEASTTAVPLRKAAGFPSGGRRGSPHNKGIQENQIQENQNHPEAVFDPVFKSILEIYPVEAVPSQQAAERAFRKIPATDHPAVLLAVHHYTAKVRGEETQARFIMRLHNFLTADFWRGHIHPLGDIAPKWVPDLSWQSERAADLAKALERVERKKREAAAREENLVEAG